MCYDNRLCIVIDASRDVIDINSKILIHTIVLCIGILVQHWIYLNPAIVGGKQDGLILLQTE